MAALDWSQCPAVESVPDRRSGGLCSSILMRCLRPRFPRVHDADVSEGTANTIYS
jgi:hypothetical protein